MNHVTTRPIDASPPLVFEDTTSQAVRRNTALQMRLATDDRVSIPHQDEDRAYAERANATGFTKNPSNSSKISAMNTEVTWLHRRVFLREFIKIPARPSGFLKPQELRLR
ncbi:hypothetical protein [Paludisphaera borealis]|uniref:hypothetical protein n=1 Tax=Paludisphaera borealis TaxID=1387353 RepID=UPI0011AB7A3C|nr:hypothetical protein [Paludisphaera borealis]